MPLSNDFLDNPMGFCQRYICIMPGTTMQRATLPRVSPPPIGSPAGSPWLNTGSFFNNREPGGHPHKTGYGVAAAAVQVCWHRLDNLRLQLVVHGSDEANALGGVLGDWFSCYFLPWNSGSIGRMEVPAQPSGAVLNPVRAFFTAEMNGCSFLAAGNPASPLVSHYNLGPGIAALSPQQKDDIQSAMVKAILRAKRGGPNLGGSTAGVLRRYAPAGAGDGLTGTLVANSASTPYTLTVGDEAALRNLVARELADQRLERGRDDIFDIRVSMMGTLDTNTRLWSFFYQRNVMANSEALAILEVTESMSNWAGWGLSFVGRGWEPEDRDRQFLQRYLRVPGWEHNVLWPAGNGHVAIPAHGDPDLA